MFELVTLKFSAFYLFRSRIFFFRKLLKTLFHGCTPDLSDKALNKPYLHTVAPSNPPQAHLSIFVPKIASRLFLSSGPIQKSP